MKKHNTVLHINYSESNNPSSINTETISDQHSINFQITNSDKSLSAGASQVSYTNHCSNNSQILLSTVNIAVLYIHGNTHYCG